MNEEELIPIKIEEAKSWFALAEILIILAGFMFALSGIYYTSSEENSKIGLSINQNIGLTNLELLKIYQEEIRGVPSPEVLNLSLEILDAQKSNLNLSTSYLGLSKIQGDLSTNCLYLGFILTILSLLFWNDGRSKISKLKKR
jgi:hypothetical protein